MTNTIESYDTGQMALTDAELTEIRDALRASLDKTEKGGIANSIKNCVIVFENDPLFAGKISRNLLTETNDMIGVFPWRRNTTRFDDQDLPHVLLHFEQYYGIRSEKNIEHAFRVVASTNSFTRFRIICGASNGTAFPVSGKRCTTSSARTSVIITRLAFACSCWVP